MRVTRATVPYFFWASIAALVTLFALDVLEVRDAGDPLTKLCIALPAMAIVGGSMIVVGNATSYLQFICRDDLGYREFSRRVLIFQRWMGAICLLSIVAQFVVPVLSYKHWPLPVSLFLLVVAFMGQYFVVWRFG